MLPLKLSAALVPVMMPFSLMYTLPEPSKDKEANWASVNTIVFSKWLMFSKFRIVALVRSVKPDLI